TSQPAPDARDATVVARRLDAHVAVLRRRHGAELDDAERLLVEAVAPLQEENRTRAVQADEQGDPTQCRQKQEHDPGCDDEVERPLLEDLERRQRLPCQLQAGDLPELRYANVVETLENALRTEMDFSRNRQQLLDAAVDRCGIAPRHDDEYGV